MNSVSWSVPRRRCFASAGLVLALVIGGVAGIAQSASAALPAGSIIQNGGFEQPVTGTGYAEFSSIPGWTGTNNCGIEIRENNYYGSAYDGAQWDQLNCDHEGGGGITQVVPTTPGRSYELGFFFAGTPYVSPDQNQFNVSFGGQVVATITPPYTTGYVLNWIYDQIPVTAVGSPTALTFLTTDTDPNDFGGSNLDDVSLVPQPTMTGRAYGLTANATLAGVPLLNVTPSPDTGSVATTSSSSTTTPCVGTLTGLISANTLCANVTTVATSGNETSTANASVESATVGIPDIPAITLDGVQSTSTTTCSGSTGSTTIAFLQVGPTVVISQPTNILPNTTVNLGVVQLVLNEQSAIGGPDAGLTVNAIDATVGVPRLVSAKVIVASSESDIGNCA